MQPCYHGITPPSICVFCRSALAAAEAAAAEREECARLADEMAGAPEAITERVRAACRAIAEKIRARGSA
jgi:hypothetical protein